MNITVDSTILDEMVTNKLENLKSLSEEKHPKPTAPFALQLVPTPDIAATLNQRKRTNQIAIGFALETREGEKNARDKLAAKRFNGIVLNSDSAIGEDRARFSYLSAQDPTSFTDWGRIEKRKCAHKVIQKIISLFQEGNPL